MDYFTPTVEIIEMKIENGFASSNESYEDGGGGTF